MQQKLCSQGTGSFLLERNGQACSAITDPVPSCDLPFRCPRCGEQERFGSLEALSSHLEHRHSYRSPDVTLGNFSITGKLPDPLTAAIPWYDMSLPTRRGPGGSGRPPHIRSLSDSRDSGYPHSYGSVRRRTQSVGVGTHANEEEEDDEDEGASEEEDGVEYEDNDEGDDRDGDRSEMSKKSVAGHHYCNHRHFFYPPPSPLGPPPDPDLDLDLIGA